MRTILRRSVIVKSIYIAPHSKAIYKLRGASGSAIGSAQESWIGVFV